MKRKKRTYRHIGASLLAIIGLLILCLTATQQADGKPAQGYSYEYLVGEWQIQTTTRHATPIQELTGPNNESCTHWSVCGTDLGIPFSLPDNQIGYLFGDTFATAIPEAPGSGDHWRSPVILKSSPANPNDTHVSYSGAAGLGGPGIAPEIMYNAHISDGEFTVIPNDGITLPNGDVIVSYMSINNWDSPWRTNYTGLALSTDGGNSFDRNAGPKWWNNTDNTDPFQMQTMQLGSDGYVYLYSVASGRQHGPMMLQRVPWQQMLDHNAYQCWNGSRFGSECQPLFIDDTAEPSVRMLHQDGHEVWVMAYLNIPAGIIGTRYATSPVGPWSDVKTQVSADELAYMYGGFIDPRSTPDHLLMAVSSWQRDEHGNTTRYNVTLYEGEL